MVEPQYEIFAIRYAWRDARRSDHFIGGDPHDGPMPIERAKYTFEHDKRLEPHIQIALTDMNARDCNVVITNYLFYEC